MIGSAVIGGSDALISTIFDKTAGYLSVLLISILFLWLNSCMLALAPNIASSLVNKSITGESEAVTLSIKAVVQAVVGNNFELMLSFATKMHLGGTQCWANHEQGLVEPCLPRLTKHIKYLGHHQYPLNQSWIIRPYA